MEKHERLDYSSEQESPQENLRITQDTDQAYEFLIKTHVSSETASHVNLDVLRRKIDWHIVPIMFCCYFIQFLDKVSLNYSAVMGLNKDLNLTGNDFTNVGTAFFVAYVIAEIPNAKWLGANVLLWGITVACTAATKDYSTLLAARIFLGIFEASIAPSLTIVSSQWYTKSEQAPRFSFWYTGVGIAQILGGLISFAFQHVSNPSFSGWKAMFVTLGCVTVAIGLGTILILPDSPIDARFLSETEKTALLHHVAVNQTGIVNRRFKIKHTLEVLLDPQIWLLILLMILPSSSSGIVTNYSATVIRNFGYTPPIAALLNMPSGVVSIASTLVAGFGIRRTSNRWAWLVAICVPGIIGGALMSFMPETNHAGLLAGVYLVNAVIASSPIVYQWAASNVAGQTKRTTSFALLSIGFGIGSIIGPQTFQAKDAPQYIPAKITVLATQAATALMSVVLFSYYLLVNWHRNRSGRTPQSVDDMSDAEKWRNLTDKENPDFRYVF
ncbi:MAG: hypothetical protein Q9157_000657 [Trypethelium eluteriae]